MEAGVCTSPGAPKPAGDHPQLRGLRRVSPEPPGGASPATRPGRGAIALVLLELPGVRHYAWQPSCLPPRQVSPAHTRGCRRERTCPGASCGRKLCVFAQAAEPLWTRFPQHTEMTAGLCHWAAVRVRREETGEDWAEQPGSGPFRAQRGRGPGAGGWGGRTGVDGLFPQPSLPRAPPPPRSP